MADDEEKYAQRKAPQKPGAAKRPRKPRPVAVVLCNGNCAVFCPWSGRPFKDKLTLFWSAEDMGNSENQGFLPQADGTFLVRLDGKTAAYDVDDAACGLPEEARLTIKAVRDSYSYLLAK